jgi:tripartite-type tricarboxylate transporter receptor subunit TctC
MNFFHIPVFLYRLFNTSRIHSIEPSFMEINMKTKILFAAFAFSLLCASATAQEYPTKPIKLMVPFPPGGTTDLIARIVSERLTQELGQPVVVDNKPGAGGSIGTEALARSAPDGYTIGMATVSTHAVVPSLFRKPAYDPIKDFVPITKIATVPNVLVARANSNVSDIPSLLKVARSAPGSVTYASPGAGTIGHLLGEEFQYVAKVELLHVPYRGAGPALNDLLGGQVALMFDNLPTSMPNIIAGKLTALAVASPTRIAQIPSVPTFAEVGLADVNDQAWFGLAAPLGTPPAVIAKLSKVLREVLATPAMKERLSKLGAVSVGNSPSEFASDIQKELTKAKTLIRVAKITLE